MKERISCEIYNSTLRKILRSLLIPLSLQRYTEVIPKVRTFCAYLSRIFEAVTLRMCGDFLYQLKKRRRRFVKFVLCLCLFLGLNMFKTIEGAADCEIRSVIRFLNARNVLPSEIHHQICQVCGDKVMSDDTVRKMQTCECNERENFVRDL